MKKLQLFLLSVLAFANASAQNLPNKQRSSVVMPSNVKIDGKATEWNNHFQAYNTATNLYYTMANNAEFVYFIGQVKDPAVIERITKNGFTFEIYKNDKSQNQELVSITIPFAGNKYFNLNLIKPTRSDTLLEQGILRANNAALHQFHKFLVVKGVPGLDSVSVYNDEAGIRFAESFDINEDYTIELQLPVKFIKLLTADNFKFSYRMVINGLPDSGPSRGLATFSPNGTIVFIPAKDISAEQQAAIEEITARIAKKNAPTDFKAEYTLAK